MLTQTKIKRVNLTFDSGLEFIWQLEDSYEQKETNNFLSLVSLDFKKNFIKFREQIEEGILNKEAIELYIYFLSIKKNSDEGMRFYEVYWIKRSKEHRKDFWQREHGRATIVLKARDNNENPRFLLFDIEGSNPFE